MRIIWLGIIIFFIAQSESVSAWAGEKYDIEILPARPYAKSYHFTCSRKSSPCSTAINVGSLFEPKVIEIEAHILQNAIQFEFFHKRQFLITAPSENPSFSLQLNSKEPKIVDLYKPHPSYSSIHAVIRTPAKFLTSLQISLSETK